MNNDDNEEEDEEGEKGANGEEEEDGEEEDGGEEEEEEEAEVLSLTRETLKKSNYMGGYIFWNPVYKLLPKSTCICKLDSLELKDGTYTTPHVVETQEIVDDINAKLVKELIGDKTSRTVFTFPVLKAGKNADEKYAIEMYMQTHGMCYGGDLPRIMATGLPFLYDGGLWPDHRDVLWELLSWNNFENSVTMKPYLDIKDPDCTSGTEVKAVMETFSVNKYGISFFPFVLAVAVTLPTAEKVCLKTSFSAFEPIIGNPRLLKILPPQDAPLEGAVNRNSQMSHAKENQQIPLLRSPKTSSCGYFCINCNGIHFCNKDCTTLYNQTASKKCPLVTATSHGLQSHFFAFDERNITTSVAEGKNPRMGAYEDTKAAEVMTNIRIVNRKGTIISYGTTDKKNEDNEKHKAVDHFFSDGSSFGLVFLDVVKSISKKGSEAWKTFLIGLQNPDPPEAINVIKNDIFASYDRVAKNSKINDIAYMTCRLIRTCLEKKGFDDPWYRELLSTMPTDSALEALGVCKPGKKTRSCLKRANRAVYHNQL